MEESGAWKQTTSLPVMEFVIDLQSFRFLLALSIKLTGTYTGRYRETLEYMYNIYRQSFISSNLVRGTHSLIDDFDEFTQAYKTCHN